jgi:hypothetical protein
MIHRQPPALALWLLRHLGPRYRNESLEGDLFEQYQQEANRSWYWQQTIVAMMLAAANWVRTRLVRIVATSSLRLLTEAAALLGALVLTQQFQQVCAARNLMDPTLLVTIAATIALVASVSFYLSLCVGRFRRDRCARRQAPPYRRMLAAFLVTALSAGTLTWASARSEPHCGPQPCACLSPDTSATASQSISAPTSLP